ncbi:MAG TPA: glutamine-hydrolyzing carbamoyl-phosphate synthase small subunit [Thermoanaerobaculaceae bacterium]|nr:glutamine-hydrolyzing carbamoyl-phosphate synthase small subunit [Thermoanaerobaculaceae bacterium]
MAERGPRAVQIARRGYGDVLPAEVVARGARRRLAPGRGQAAAGSATGAATVSGAKATRRRAAIVGGPRIVYPHASMNTSLLPAILAGPRHAWLGLADGTVLQGFAAGGGTASGEVVFNTSMFGYQEMLTDPSYRGQILVLTAPHVGNVGVNEDDRESGRFWAEGLIVPDLSLVPSNWRSAGGLLASLQAQGVPVAWGFDTRALVLRLREKGALPGVLVCGREPSPDEMAALVAAAHGTDGCDLTRQVACSEPFTWREAPWHPPGNGARCPAPGPRVVVIDCGAKRSIFRQLVGAGAEVVVVPPDTGADAVLALSPGGVVVSNGPGDPAAVAGVAETLAALLGRLPVLGICLGHQLLARALGGSTYKLPFGHHGANHPVRDSSSGTVWITSQNHNYAVEPASLPAGAGVSMTNLTDGSVEGIRADALLAEGIQFHPEAGPGPHDALGVFARFVARCERHA